MWKPHTSGVRREGLWAEETHRSVTGVAFLQLRDPGAKMDVLPTVPCCFHHISLFGEEKRKVS